MISYSEQPMSATPLQLGTSPTTIHTVPANARDTVQALILKNNSASAIAYEIFAVPNGDTADDDTSIEEGILPAGSRGYIVSAAIGLVLAAGGTIQGTAGTASEISVQGAVLRAIGSS